MNYIAAAFFANLEDEELTFDIFMALIISKQLMPLFQNGVPEYHLRNFILNKLIKQELPALHQHFNKLQLNLEMLTGNWIMTLFAGYFPYKMFIPVIDNFFREGWPAIYRMSLALLKLWEKEFLQLNDIAFVAKKLYELREDFNIKAETLFTLAYSPSIDKAFGTDGNLLV